MTGFLVRVGVDGTYGEWNAPVDPDDSSFVYVPIPESVDSQRTGLEASCRESEAALAEYDGTCSGQKSSSRFTSSRV